MLSDLQLNRKKNILSVILHISNSEMLLFYKSAVPYVNVPAELIEQWTGQFLYNRSWFREIYTDNEMLMLIEFNRLFIETIEGYGKNIPDAPEILECDNWIVLSNQASKIIPFLVD